ncbi:hypothetical protein JDW22_00255 [Kingella sp. Marseille-Q4569]|uniref:Secreted protein n=1 Tax=Kingella bonacorsii TaxID=2796361 RepID=A0ABS1BQ88_9NEIS|nr:hypothetical protein [Kingella bonacorsii]MBK0395050.1 hypothetical protein [Kingella bonacorsii]
MMLWESWIRAWLSAWIWAWAAVASAPRVVSIRASGSAGSWIFCLDFLSWLALLCRNSAVKMAWVWLLSVSSCQMVAGLGQPENWWSRAKRSSQRAAL